MLTNDIWLKIVIRCCCCLSTLRFISFWNAIKISHANHFSFLQANFFVGQQIFHVLLFFFHFTAFTCMGFFSSYFWEVFLRNDLMQANSYSLAICCWLFIKNATYRHKWYVWDKLFFLYLLKLKLHYLF